MSYMYSFHKGAMHICMQEINILISDKKTPKKSLCPKLLNEIKSNLKYGQNLTENRKRVNIWSQIFDRISKKKLKIWGQIHSKVSDTGYKSQGTMRFIHLSLNHLI